jgi:hypothetical protein
MSVAPLYTKARHVAAFIAIVLLGGFFLGLFTPDYASALLYRTPEGTLKDNCVVWQDGVFYLFAMYRTESKGSEQEQWRNVWLATSADGVHWKDVGPVIKDAPFGIYAMRVWKAGNRFLMNHGSFTGDKQDVLRLWASSDLVHWEYLGPDYDVRRPDGQRIDHMDVISEEEAGKTVYYGYAVGGLLRSEDGAKWTWIGELPLTDDLSVRVVQEPGGCQRIGDKYYLLVGGFYPGSFEYAVATYIADRPAGPFRPDYPAFRLNGYSGRDLVALWAGYCRLPNEVLLTNYMLDPGGLFWWHAPLKTPVVDGAGHLHMRYWKGNDALKGPELPCEIGPLQLASPNPKGGITVSQDSATIAAPALPQVRWITPDQPNIAVAFLNETFDFDKGCVVEGSMKVAATDALVFPAAGICLEQEGKQATAVLFETWGQTEIGRLAWSEQPRFEARDRTGFGCATVAGIPAGATCSYRLLIRKGIFEIYLNDLLVQTYSVANLTGRIGFVTQDGEGVFGRPKAWAMTLR